MFIWQLLVKLRYLDSLKLWKQSGIRVKDTRESKGLNPAVLKRIV